MFFLFFLKKEGCYALRITGVEAQKLTNNDGEKNECIFMHKIMHKLYNYA